MKCAMCDKGNLGKKIIEYKEFGISLGRFKANVCKNWGEIFFDEETAKRIQDKSRKLGLFGLAKKTKIAKVGNSLAIRIPKKIADFLKLKKEKEVRIVPKNPNELSIEII